MYTGLGQMDDVDLCAKTNAGLCDDSIGNAGEREE
jgi:hypothetical protein